MRRANRKSAFKQQCKTTFAPGEYTHDAITEACKNIDTSVISLLRAWMVYTEAYSWCVPEHRYVLNSPVSDGMWILFGGQTAPTSIDETEIEWKQKRLNIHQICEEALPRVAAYSSKPAPDQAMTW